MHCSGSIRGHKACEEEAPVSRSSHPRWGREGLWKFKGTECSLRGLKESFRMEAAGLKLKTR